MARIVPIVLIALGAYQLAQGAWMALDPRSFYDAIGPFGPYNAHYLRDAATWSLALGVVLMIATWRPSWRVPALAFAALEFALHTVNHIADVGEAHTTGIGVFDAVSLGVLTAVLVALLLAALGDGARSLPPAPPGRRPGATEQASR